MSRQPELELTKKVKPGSTLRVEIDIGEFYCHTMRLTTAEVGELQRLLMIEAVGAPVPLASTMHVARAYLDRRQYSRIRGSFARSSLSLAKRKAVYERDDATCGYCGSYITWAEYHCDHVEPVAKGGSSDLSNLRASCWRCNLSKKDRTLEAWRP